MGSYPMMLVRIQLAVLVLIVSATGVSLSDPPETVDLIERNHVCNEFGREQLDQVIAWQFAPALGMLVCREWQLTRTAGEPTPAPNGKGCIATFRDKTGVIRVRGTTYRETWTAVDPEVQNREIVPVERRQKLFR